MTRTDLGFALLLRHVGAHATRAVSGIIPSKKSAALALTRVVWWVGRHPANQTVASSIPGQGTCLSCGSGPLSEACESQPIDVSLPLFLPPFPSLNEINK